MTLSQSAQRRTHIEERRAKIARRAVGFFVLSSAICVLRFSSGCAENKPPSTQPVTPEERQAAALKDPMDYKPQIGGDVSGGDIGNFDRDGFNKDMHDFFNP